MKYPLLAMFVALLLGGSAPKKPCLCKATEENIFSFQTLKSRNILSVCSEKKDGYMVYRYGTGEKTELVFPDKLDQSSWRKFVYKGYYRGGGPQNLAMSNQSLSFTNQGVEYEIYDQSGYEDTTEESFSQQAGILVRVNGKEVDLQADLKTISGGLENLNQYASIENQYGQ